MKDDRKHGDVAFDSNLGSKATIEHHAIADTGEITQLREVLSDMGKDLQKIGAAPKEMEYMGSFSVHVYAAEGLKGSYAFVALTQPGKCFYKLAEAAGKKLQGDIQLTYRGKFQKKRSGFANG